MNALYFLYYSSWASIFSAAAPESDRLVSPCFFVFSQCCLSAKISPFFPRQNWPRLSPLFLRFKSDETPAQGRKRSPGRGRSGCGRCSRPGAGRRACRGQPPGADWTTTHTARLLLKIRWGGGGPAGTHPSGIGGTPPHRGPGVGGTPLPRGDLGGPKKEGKKSAKKEVKTIFLAIGRT